MVVLESSFYNNRSVPVWHGLTIFRAKKVLLVYLLYRIRLAPTQRSWLLLSVPSFVPPFVPPVVLFASACIHENIIHKDEQSTCLAALNDPWAVEKYMHNQNQHKIQKPPHIKPNNYTFMILFVFGIQRRFCSFTISAL